MSDRSRRRGALSIPLVAHAHGAKFPSSHKFTVGDHLLEGRQAPSVCLGRVPPGQRFFVRRMSPKVAHCRHCVRPRHAGALSRFEGRGDLEAEISERYAVIRMKTG